MLRTGSRVLISKLLIDSSSLNALPGDIQQRWLGIKQILFGQG